MEAGDHVVLVIDQGDTDQVKRSATITGADESLDRRLNLAVSHMKPTQSST